jgi:trehalose utilization protein
MHMPHTDQIIIWGHRRAAACCGFVMQRMIKRPCVGVGLWLHMPHTDQTIIWDIIEPQPCCGFVMQRMTKFFIKGE